MGKKITYNDATVVDLKQEPQRLTPKKLIAKRPAQIVLAFFILSIIAWLVFVQPFGNGCNKACQDQKTTTIRQAALALGSNNRNDLAVVVTRIQQLPDFQKDPNYLYPVVVYYASITDYQNAQKYYDLLTKVYNAKTGFDGSYHQNGGLDSVKMLVDNAKKVQDQAKENVFYPN